MQNLALFDFDGTITSKDTYTAFIHHAVPPARLVLGKVVLSPLIVGYKLGWVSGGTIRTAVSAFGFAGRNEQEIREAGVRFSNDVLPGVMRPAMLERIDWHKARGDRIMIVSASLDVYLAEWCARLGLELICTELAFRGGRATGRYRRGDCSGDRKLAWVRERCDLDSFADIHAYGDTKDDLAMLRVANYKMYRGKPVMQAELEASAAHHAHED